MASLSYFKRRHRLVPALAALLTLMAGVLNILSALTPAIRTRAREVNDVLPGALSHSATALTLVFGILLIPLARALRRRKQRAPGCWSMDAGRSCRERRAATSSARRSSIT